jgi:putative FmdB family regulatory protein
MPIYQYACPDCGLEFERQQKFIDDPIKRCPKCGKRRVYRVVSKVAVTFKGSGWYITDSKNGKDKSTSETKQEDKSETKETAKTEAAPAEAAQPATAPGAETGAESKSKAEKKPSKSSKKKSDD